MDQFYTYAIFIHDRVKSKLVLHIVVTEGLQHRVSIWYQKVSNWIPFEVWRYLFEIFGIQNYLVSFGYLFKFGEKPTKVIIFPYNYCLFYSNFQKPFLNFEFLSNYFSPHPAIPIATFWFVIFLLYFSTCMILDFSKLSWHCFVSLQFWCSKQEF